MSNIFKLQESFTTVGGANLPDNLIVIISILSVICGIFVIVSKNPIVSVLFLIGLFLTVASYLMILGISFIGLSYLLVYVGAVSILFLFILMLINVRVSELVTDNYNSVPLSIITIMVFSMVFNDKIPSSFIFNSGPIHFIETNKGFNVFNLFDNKEINLNNVNFATSNNWDTALAQVSHISSIGNILYTSYPMLLIVTSIILLLAMVGAIVITIKQ